MFALGFREGLEAGLIVAFIAAAVRGTPTVRMLRLAVVAAVGLSAGLVAVVRAVHLDLDATTRHSIKVVVALVAVAILTSTVRWSGSFVSEPHVAHPTSNRLAVVAFLAVLREGLELAIFPAAGADDRWGPGTPAMIAGVVVAASFAFVVYTVCSESQVRLALATAVPLVLIAAGLVASAIRSAQEAFDWNHRPVFDARWAGNPDGWLPSLIKGVFGIHASPTALEIVGHATYLAVMAVIVWRLFGAHRSTVVNRRPTRTHLA